VIMAATLETPSSIASGGWRETLDRLRTGPRFHTAEGRRFHISPRDAEPSRMHSSPDWRDRLRRSVPFVVSEYRRLLALKSRPTPSAAGEPSRRLDTRSHFKATIALFPIFR